MLEELIRRANTGDSEAMLQLAMAYSKEELPEVDQEASDWYKGELANLTGAGSSLDSLDNLEPDFDEAIRWYEEAYKHGEPLAYSYLASLYEDGRGVEEDDERAEYYYKEATKSGNAITYLALGNFYENKMGNLFEAIQAYRESVNRDNIYDADSLGRAYYKAALEMENENPEQAQMLYDRGKVAYEKSAEADNPEAMYWLGEIYRQGLGAEQDEALALEWHGKASALGHTESMIQEGTYYAREGASQEELNIAKEHFQKAADAGSAGGLYCLAEWYSLVSNEEYDLNKAVDLMIQAIENSEEDYFPYLARMNTADPLVSQEEAEKLFAERGQFNIESPEFYEERSKQGDKVAMFRLANAYRDGNGVEQDVEQAIHWYEKSGELGNIGVCLPLATLYYEGRLIEQDIEKSIGYLTYSAKYNDSAAMYNLGYLYHANEDFDVALSWYKLASRFGHLNAKFRVGNIYLSEFSEEDEEYYDIGMAWMYDAAMNNHPDALFIIGVEMAYGETFGHNPELAIEMLSRASQLGDPEADAHIEQIREDFNL